MPSINLIKASDGTGNASTATVQTVRNSGVTTIIVDTVNNIPATFMGSMGTPHTFVDPVTAEEITVISEATAVDFTGHVSGANLEIDSIAPGYTDLGSAVGDIIVIRPTTDWANNIATVLAADHNQDGTHLFSGAWSTWSKTTVGWSSLISDDLKYKQIGKTVFIRGEINGTANSGTTTITLPVNASYGSYFCISVLNGASGWIVGGCAISATAMECYSSTWGSLVSTGNKMLRISIFYEAA